MHVLQRLSARRAIIFGAGILVLGLGAFAGSERRHPAGEVDRWVLQTERDPICYYASSWNDGDLWMPRAAAEHGTLRFEHEYLHEDDCTWHAVETLIPDGDNHFRYVYSEEPISCPEGSEPAEACPLTGSVLIVAQ